MLFLFAAVSFKHPEVYPQEIQGRFYDLTGLIIIIIGVEPMPAF